MDERERAYRAVYKIFFGNGLSHEVLRESLDESDRKREKANKAFISRLVNGTTERWLTLTYLIEKQAGRPITKIKPAIRVILAMGIYQAFFMNVPESAAANESVKLAKNHSFGGLAGFVNGVLRNIFRLAASFGQAGENKEKCFEAFLENKLENEEEDKKLSVRFSVPGELAGIMRNELGKEALQKTLEGFFKENSLCLYRLGSKCSEEEFEESLAKDKLSFIKKEETGLEKAYIIKTAVNPTSVECFKRGCCIVQNPSSVKACELLEVRGDEKALDVCAAPGGKAVHLADRLKEGFVTACDVSDKKCLKIEENIKRTGLKNIAARTEDATVFVPEFKEAFDIVIADLPCSGLGVISSKPDIRYKTSADDIKILAGIQKKILENVTKYVKPGGLISFSTCTFTKQENEDNAEYIKSLGFAELIRQRMLPDEDRDGFFVAILKKQ